MLFVPSYTLLCLVLLLLPVIFVLLLQLQRMDATLYMPSTLALTHIDELRDVAPGELFRS
jgi:hypothetical protein